jgi:hypothetical protein
MHGAGHVVVLLVLAVICCGGLVSVGRRGLAAHRGGGAGSRPKARGGWLAHRRALRLERMRHENASVRDNAKHRHRMVEQEAARKAKVEKAATGTRGKGGRGDGDDGKAVRLGDKPAASSDAKPASRPPDAPASRSDAPPPPPPSSGPPVPPRPPAPSEPPPAPAGARSAPATRPAPPPPPPHRPVSPASPQAPPARGGAAPSAPARPAPGASPSPILEGVVMADIATTSAAAVPGVEQAVEGVRRIHAHARAGNIRAKRRAMLALMVICRHGAVMASAMARALAEPDQHYGPEVTEPISEGAMYLTAAASAFGEGDNSLKSLLQSSVDETMRAGRRMPHHDELTETGAY